METAAIKVRDLKVTRGSRLVLPGISLDVTPGQILGVLGSSGVGKSTLIRAIAGVQKIDSGTITVLGKPAGSPEARRNIGYMTQSSSVYRDLTVRENIVHWAKIARLSDPQAAANAILDRLHLTENKNQLAANVSGGQASRLSLACAIVGNPKVQLLDEPTVGLDPILREEIWDFLRTEASNGKTILVSSHAMDEASRCDSLIFIREGSILAAGTQEEILARTGATTMEHAFLTLAKEQQS